LLLLVPNFIPTAVGDALMCFLALKVIFSLPANDDQQQGEKPKIKV
jgi:hypothetical protein